MLAVRCPTCGATAGGFGTRIRLRVGRAVACQQCNGKVRGGRVLPIVATLVETIWVFTVLLVLLYFGVLTGCAVALAAIVIFELAMIFLVRPRPS